MTVTMVRNEPHLLVLPVQLKPVYSSEYSRLPYIALVIICNPPLCFLQGMAQSLL